MLEALVVVKQDHPLFEETRVAITGMDMMFSNLLN
jgi:hypothetical protein